MFVGGEEEDRISLKKGTH